MSDFTGPGRNSEMSMMMSSNVSGENFATSSRWPGDSIWKQPSVAALAIMSYVAGSSNGARASMSTCSDSVRSIWSSAWANADCIRIPSTSSLSSPMSSTSSLSNWLIG